MKILLAALLSAALIILAPHQAQGTPSQINNLEPKPAQPAAVEQTPVVQAEHPTQPVAAEVTQAVQTVAVQPEPPVDNSEALAKAFIYEHESGNDPTSENSIGCYGLGQDCNGIVKRKCGASYSCQDHFFTNYMLNRYGTWQAAKSHWIARVPINGRSVGHWW